MIGRVEKVVEHEPETARVMEKKHGKDNRKGHPQHELLIDVDGRQIIENKKSRHGDGDGGRVIDVDRPDEISLLALEP